jgi:hypothetical protein
MKFIYFSGKRRIHVRRQIVGVETSNLAVSTPSTGIVVPYQNVFALLLWCIINQYCELGCTLIYIVIPNFVNFAFTDLFLWFRVQTHNSPWISKVSFPLRCISILCLLTGLLRPNPIPTNATTHANNCCFVL